MKLSFARVATLAAGVAIGTALVLGATGAQQTNEAEMRKAFAAADVNADGYLDVNEFVAHTIYIFKQVDKDGDGYISMQEWSAHNPGLALERFKAADRNGDGKISPGEAVAVKMIEFFDIDTNRDGAITLDQLLAYERSLPAVTARK
jgi:Ca2+-binding EF-hand superfamily protein